MQVRGMGHHFRSRSCMLLRAKDSEMELLSQEDDMHSWGRAAAHRERSLPHRNSRVQIQTKKTAKLYTTGQTRAFTALSIHYAS